MVLVPKSLQGLCLTHITTTLEQYSTDVLSLLPRKFREQLLRNIPVLDVCRLEEDSSFTAGIYMDSLWKELSDKLIVYGPNSHYYRHDTKLSSSRESFFKKLFDAVFQGDRLYGYFDVSGVRHWLDYSDKIDMTDDRPVYEHNVDFVNFLVAIKSCNVPLESEEATYSKYQHYGSIRETLDRYRVTLVKGPVPPGHTYHESCRIHQLVPPRYAKLFPEDSCYLPDSTALQLITEKCRYRPKELSIGISIFATFLLNVEKECGSVNCLKNCFKGVESVTISDSECCDISSEKWEQFKTVAGQALELILQSPDPMLTCLIVDTSVFDDTLDSIMPVLFRFDTLEKFSLSYHTNIFVNFSTLSSIVEHHRLLKTISIDEHVMYGANSSFDLPVFSREHFVSFIQTCLKSPSLQELKLLTVDQPSSQLVLKIISMFLSTPCSHQQTLVIEKAMLGNEIQARIPVQMKGQDQPAPSMARLSPYLQASKEFALQLQSPDEPPLPTIPPPLPTSVQSKDPPTYQFDDALTLKYKCLSFVSCTFHDSFIDEFFQLAPLKLQKVTLNKNTGPLFLFQLAQNPLIEMKSLEILLLELLPGQEKNFFRSLSQKKSLKGIKFSCLDREALKFDDASFRYFNSYKSHTNNETSFILSKK